MVSSPGANVRASHFGKGVDEMMAWDLEPWTLDEFLQALKTGAVPNGECHDNIVSLAMVFAAIQSSREGRKVRLDEVL